MGYAQGITKEIGQLVFSLTHTHKQVRDLSLSEIDIAKIILQRFKESGIVVSFAEIARVAKQEKRTILATHLLEHEVLVSDQVQMLMEMNDADKALDKAIGSWDAQLGKGIVFFNKSLSLTHTHTVYEVLEKIKGRQTTADYMKVFNHRPLAAALYKKVSTNKLIHQIKFDMFQYCKENNFKGLVNLYRQESDSLGAGVHLLAQSYSGKVNQLNHTFVDSVDVFFSLIPEVVCYPIVSS